MKRVYEFLLWLIGAGLLVVVILLAERAHGREVSYQEGYDAYTIGQPLTVVCSASWCPACHALIRELQSSEIPFVALDVERPVVAGIYESGSIPQTVVYRKGKGIVRRVGNLGLKGLRACLKD